jgi:hypothetical protein
VRTSWAFGSIRWFLGLAAALLVGCIVMAVGRFFWRSYAYQSALEDASKRITAAREFLKLYPEAECQFSYYTGEYGPPTWVGTSGLYGRYILQMEVPVSISSSGKKVKSFGEPKCYLKEVEHVTVEEGGRVAYTCGPTQVRFGPKDWQTIVQNRGDLSSSGVTIVKDHPIPNFDNCWRHTPGRTP